MEQTPDSATKKLAMEFLGKPVRISIDRPFGSKHPKHGFVYEANYGYVPGTLAPDGEELDAYFLGANEPLDQAVGDCIAVIHRLDDDDDKLIVVPAGTGLTDEEIEKAVRFQEQWFKHELIRPVG
ncbi:MAG: inorganic diphosphatase [Patescibacteria group bacterium]